MSLTTPPLPGDDMFDDESGACLGAIDLHALCEEAIARVRGELKSPLPIETDYGTIPEVQGRRDDLFQVLVNVLLNAQDAVSRGARAGGRVTVVTRGGTDQAIVEIHARPSRANGPTTPDAPVQWEGFGLSACENILEALGGSITVETSAELGTTFRMIVPVTRMTVRPPRAAPPPSSAAAVLEISTRLSPIDFVTPSAFPSRPSPSAGPIRTRTREMFAVKDAPFAKDGAKTPPKKA